MIVVSDTSPLTALMTVGEVSLLPQLFTEVVIPKTVQEELLRSHPCLPGWLRVEVVKDSHEALRLAAMVDPGEAEAIELAKELRADRLLIDERKGRRLAAQEGVAVIGLVGVLLLAKRQQLIPSVGTLLERLGREAGMYLSEGIRHQALRAADEES
jgi:hypothetical protein